MPLSHIRFQNLLYRKFVSPGEHDAKIVAPAIGLNLSTFYNYIEAVSYCPVDLVSLLYNATKDTEFLSFVTDLTDKKLTDRAPIQTTKTIPEEALDVASAIGMLINRVHKALADSNLSLYEASDLLKKIEGSRREIDELEASIREKFL